MPHCSTIFRLGTLCRGRASDPAEATWYEVSGDDGRGRLPRLPVNRAVSSAASHARAGDLCSGLAGDFCQYGTGRVGGACHLVPIAVGPREDTPAETRTPAPSSQVAARTAERRAALRYQCRQVMYRKAFGETPVCRRKARVKLEASVYPRSSAISTTGLSVRSSQVAACRTRTEVSTSV